MNRALVFATYLLGVGLAVLASCSGQTPGSAEISSSPVPSTIRFSGNLTYTQGTVTVVFALYTDQVGGEPLWQETQNVNPDVSGRYTIYLGANHANGAPLDMFASGSARWIGVQPEGQEEYPRVALVSVPYALKAADANTLGGQPLSAFVLAASTNGGTTVPGETAVSSVNDSALEAEGTASTTRTQATANDTPVGVACPTGIVGGVCATNFVAEGSPWIDVRSGGAKCDGATDDTPAISGLIAANSGRVIFFPDAVCKVSILYAYGSVKLMGERKPTWNFATNSYQNGTVIQGTIAVTGNFFGWSVENLGIDSRNSGALEGISAAGINGSTPAPLTDILIKDVSVVGLATSSHLVLLENVDRVQVKNLELINGIQGLAVKGTDVLIDGIRGYDQGQYTVTLRQSPSEVGLSHVSVNNVLATHVKNSTGGTVVLMNSEAGMKAHDVDFNNIRVDGPSLYAAGFQIDNSGGNTSPATNIHVNNLTVENSTGYAVQTIGPVNNVSFNGVYLLNDAGAFYDNADTTVHDVTMTNWIYDNVGAPAVTYAGGYVLSNFKRIGTTGTVYFSQNYSPGLQYFNIDRAFAAPVNVGNGASVGLATDPTLVRSSQNNVYSSGTTQSFDGITFGGNVDYIAGTLGKVGIYNTSGNAYFGGKVWVGDFSSFSKVNSTTGFEFNYTPGYTGTKRAGACLLTIQGGIITSVTGC